MKDLKKVGMTFMAVSIGKESVEGSFKLYKGVGAFNVVAVNPTKAELEKLQGRELEKEPEYKGKTEDGVDTMRVVFYLRTNPEAKINNGVNLLLPVSFLLTNANRVGAESGKTQVIDKYGRFAWATEEDLATKSIPTYSSGPANICADYRPAYRGEEELINFLIKWLNIPTPANYKNGKWVMRDNPTDSEVSLNMKAILSGDVKELADLVKLAPTYTVKACVGIRTTDEGRQYQAVFTREFAKNAVTDYSKIDAAIVEYMGRVSNVSYSSAPLHEDVVEATDFTKTEEASDLPFSATPSATPWG